MSKTLTEIAEQLKASPKKVQLIYAFNGTGKTRLSREFKELLAEDMGDENDSSQISDLSQKNILYYNAFTEDLFFWDNDLNSDEQRELKIQPNAFTKWIFEDQGQDQSIIHHFRRLTNSKVTPQFNEAFSAVSFSLTQGDGSVLDNLKISKGEESNLIWSVFYSLLYLVKEERNIVDPESRSTNDFDNLEYIFIDDPVSSLDENHLIQLAVDLAELIRSSDYSGARGLKFIVATHSPIFYNVLHNELGLNKGNKKEGCYLLEQLEDGTYHLDTKYGDSNKSFSYHLQLKRMLEHAIQHNLVERHHFSLLRNLYEKTASFLGYPEWGVLLETAPGDKQGYLNRIIQFTSHNTLAGEAFPEPNPQEKQMVKLLLDNLINNYSYWQQEAQNGQ